MRLPAIVSVLLLFCSSLCFAQSFRGGILGTVTDKTGASVAGAQVIILNPQTGLTRTVTTDDRGNYTAPELPLGNYSVTVKKIGFRSETVKSVAVVVSANTAANVTLVPGEVDQVVEVTAAAPLVETTADTQGGTIQGQQAEQLPVNGGDFIKLLTLVPGATGDPSQAGDSPGSFGLFSVNGSRGRSNNYLLDGTDMNDGYRNLPAINEAGVFGTPAVVLPIEAIAEVPVISGAEVEYGRNSGAIVNLVTKSGTNTLHGSAYEFFRNNALDARNYFNSKPLAQDAFHNNQFGGSLGGKIVRDKSFFFIAYEGQREKVGIPSIATVPSAADIATATADNGGVVNPVIAQLLARNPWPAPNLGGNSLEASTLGSNRVDSVIGKIDQHIGNNDTLSARYFFGDSDQSFPLALLGGNVLPGNNTTTPTRVQVLSLSAIHIISPSLLLEIRGGWNRYAQQFLPEDHAFDPNSIGLNTTTNPADFGLPVIAVSGFATIGSNASLPRGRVDTNWQYFTNLSYSQGAHNYKFGYEFRRTFVNGFFDAGHRGKLSFSSLDNFIAGNISSGSQSMGYSTRDTHQNNHALYAQDSWKVTRRLTINYGVRWDYYGVIGEQKDRFSLFDTTTAGLLVPKQLYPRDFGNYAVRGSFAYDLTGSGRTVLRAGGGEFYDAFSQDFFVGQLPFNTSNAGVGYNGIGVAPILFSSHPIATLVPGQPVFAASAFSASDVSTVDQKLRTPRYKNYNVNIERQLTSYSAIDIAYVGSVGRNLFRFRDINQVTDPVTGARPFPAFGYINQLETTATSNYNSLQTSLKLHAGKRLNATLNYTWGHSIDNASDGQDYVPNASQPDNGYNPNAERASSNFDTRNRFTAYLTYDLPGSSFLPRLTSGWSVNSVITHSTGQPYNVNYLFEGDFNGSGELFGRPDVVGDLHAGTSVPTQLLNLSALAVPCNYDPSNTKTGCSATNSGQHFGNLGRNAFNGPAYTDIDLSLAKSIKITERFQAQLRIDAFNLFNHPNFSNPLLPSFGVDFAADGLTANGRGIGYLSTTATPDVGTGNPFLGGGGPRNLQLSLKLSF
ncbi:MAG: carboxypeptidase regulatory-like domain-containing protein [Acidobacteriaceae bacterium]